MKNSKVKKISIYKQVINYFPSRYKIKYLIVFLQKFLFLKCFLKFLTNILVKKPSNTIFSIKMENNIFNSLYTESLVSPCTFKLIIYIYKFSYSEAAIHKDDWSSMGLEPSPRVYACKRCRALTD